MPSERIAVDSDCNLSLRAVIADEGKRDKGAPS